MASTIRKLCAVTGNNPQLSSGRLSWQLHLPGILKAPELY